MAAPEAARKPQDPQDAPPPPRGAGAAHAAAHAAAQDTPHRRLLNFLRDCRAAAGSEFTHTSFGEGGVAGRFYVFQPEQAALHGLVAECVRAGQRFVLLEKPRDCFPMIADLDLKAARGAPPPPPGARLYTPEQAAALARVYCEALHAVHEAPDDALLYLLERAAPSGAGKDGLHLCAPACVGGTPEHLAAREAALPGLRRALAAMPRVDGDAERTADAAVLRSATWHVYGSGKPGAPPYLLTRAFRIADGEEVSPPPLAGPDHLEAAIAAFSVRGAYEPCGVRPAAREAVAAHRAELERRAAAQRADAEMLGGGDRAGSASASAPAPPLAGSTAAAKPPSKDDLDFARALVRLLSPARADEYGAWMRVGFCLKNISDKLADDWEQFSRRSPKYRPGECRAKWAAFRHGPLGLGSLLFWARQDDPAGAARAVEANLGRLVREVAAENTHHAVARVVHCMFKNRFACVSAGGRCERWYEFREAAHCWQRCEGAIALRALISTEVYHAVVRGVRVVDAAIEDARRQQVAGMEDRADDADAAPLDPDLQDSIKKMRAKSDTLMRVAVLLRDVTYKAKLMRECAELFFVPGFEARLDQQPALLVFANGVLDLDTGALRPGQPEDMLSLSTGVAYRPEVPEGARAEIDAFFAQILTKPEVRAYAQKLLGSALHGSTRDQKMHFFNGCGANAKSTLMELVERTLGEYFRLMPVALLTGKRVAGNAACSELTVLKGARVVVTQEPGDREVMNAGFMKELTGSDMITARPMYGEPMQFRPQFKLLMMCNHMPALPADDGGAFRRVRVVEFTSVFKDDPDPEAPHEFLKDPDLAERMRGWCEPFAAMLVEWYGAYRREGLREPQEVMRCTLEYQRSHDAVADYVRERLQAAPGARVTLSNVYVDFRNWARTGMSPNVAPPLRAELRKALELRIGKVTGSARAEGWAGWRFAECGDAS